MADFSLIKDIYSIQEGVGFTIDEINVPVQRYGDLPKVLKEYYSTLGKERFNFTRDVLIAPSSLYTLSDDYLCFYEEENNECYWCLHKGKLLDVNPPVYYTADRVQYSQEADSLSEFLEYMALIQGLFYFEHSVDQIRQIDRLKADNIRKQFIRHSGSLTNWKGAEIYSDSSDNIILLVPYDIDIDSDSNDAEYLLAYSARCPNRFSKLDRFFCDLCGE